MSEQKKEIYRFFVTADCLVMSVHEGRLYILLIKRDQNPYRQKWAIPGGFIDMAETAKQTALRKLKEETNLVNVDVEQFHAFTSLKRDPRGRVITIAYVAIIPFEELKYSTGLRSQDSNVFYITMNCKNEIILQNDDLTIMERDLAFDHNVIINEVIKYLSTVHNELNYSLQ